MQLGMFLGYSLVKSINFTPVTFSVRQEKWTFIIKESNFFALT
jgi:hypothetical protein